MSTIGLNKHLTTLTALTLAVAALVTTPFLTVSLSISKHAAIYPLVIVVLTILILKFISAKKIAFIYSRTDYWLLLFAVFVCVSFKLADNEFIAFYGSYGRFFGAATLLTFIGWYFISRQAMVTDASIYRLFKWLTAVLTAVSIYGILQYLGIDIFSYIGVEFSSHSAFATLGNPNNLAGFIVLVLPLPFILYLKASREKNYYLLVLLLAFTALLLTFTRGSWLAAFTSILMLVFFSLQDKKHKQDTLKLLLGIGAVILLISAFTYFSSSQVTDVSKPLTSVVTADGRIKERLQAYEIAILSLRDKPLFGYGPDHFAYAFDRNQTRTFVDASDGLLKFDNAHSYFLQLGVTLGLPAAAALAIFLVIVLYKGLRHLLELKKKKQFDLITLGAFAACFGYIVHLKFAVEDLSSMLIFFTLAAVVANRSGGKLVVSFDPVKSKGLFNTIKGAFLGFIPIVLIVSAGYLGMAYYKYLRVDNVYLQVKKYEAKKDLSNTDKYLTLTKSASGSNPYYYYRSGLYYYDKSFELDNIDLAYMAAADFEKAASLDPVDADIRLSLGKSYLDIGEFDPDFKKEKAENEFKRTIALSPNYRSAHILLALVMIRKDEPEKALGHLKTARLIDPDFKPTYYYLGVAYQKLSKFKEAKENFLIAVDDPDYKLNAEAALRGLNAGLEKDLE